MPKVVRFYPNVLKLLLYLLISGTFVGSGYFLIQQLHAIFIGWLVMGFFGLCTVVVLMLLVTAFRPMLTIDEYGIRSSLFFNSRAAMWPDIASIQIFQQNLPRGGPFYYLVIAPKVSGKARRNFVQLLNSAYPEFANALVYLPLVWLFLRTTPRQRERLLQRIEDAFPEQIAANYVVINKHLGRL